MPKWIPFLLFHFTIKYIKTKDRPFGDFHGLGFGLHRPDGRSLQVSADQSFQSGQPDFSLRDFTGLRHHVRRGPFQHIFKNVDVNFKKKI